MHDETAQSIVVILSAIADLAKSVQQAQADGQIQWYEATSLALAATTAAGTVMTTIRDLSEMGLDDFVRVIADLKGQINAPQG